MDFRWSSTKDVELIFNKFAKDYQMIFKGSPKDFITISNGFPMSFQIITKGFLYEFIRIPFGLQKDVQGISRRISNEFAKGFLGILKQF